MADLDHIYDVDNDVNYTLKDTGARNDIVTINSKLLNEVYPVCFCVGGGWVVQDREYNLILTEWSNARFNPEYDNDVMNVRVRFYDFQTPSPFDDDILIDIDTVIEAQHRQLPVYLDKEKTIRATIGHIRGRTVDFIYVPLERTYYLVNERILSEDVVFDTTNTRLSSTNVQDAIAELDDDLALLTASQVGYDHTSSGLVAITVQDAIDEIASGSGGGTAASISYDNTGSGLQATDVQDAIDEVVDDLGDKADTSSLATVATSGDYGDLINTPTLATVATSGDYDDLTNKPDLSALPYLENIAAAQDYNPLISYSYRDFVKYNNKLYLCSSSSGSTPGPFDPTEWSEIIIGKQAREIDRVATLASNNENRLNNLAPVATTGAYSDLTGTPSIPAAQVNSDWNAISGVAEIMNKPTLATVATSGLYSDLSGTPTLATVATSGNYSDLNGTPALATVATSGDYDDLTDKPTFKTINGDAITGTGNITTPDTYPDNWFFNDSLPDVTGLASGGTWARLGSVNIPTTGTWLITAAVQYPSNSTGYRGCGLYVGTSATPTDVTGIRYQQTVQAANGAATNIVLTTPATFSSARNIWIMGRQTSGSAMGTSASPIRVRISAIRLTPSYT